MLFRSVRLKITKEESVWFCKCKKREDSKGAEVFREREREGKKNNEKIKEETTKIYWCKPIKRHC